MKWILNFKGTKELLLETNSIPWNACGFIIVLHKDVQLINLLKKKLFCRILFHFVFFFVFLKNVILVL